MDETRSNGRRIRFGPFEADLTACELLKNGKRTPIQEQPFQVLGALLEQPGEVVTREFLRDRLWRDQPFGDFDQGLNTAINKLREALGDSASNPRFVETVPRRGYRFVHAVEAEEAAAAPIAATAAPSNRRWIPAVAGIALVIGGWALWTPRATEHAEGTVRRFAFPAPFYCPATIDCRSAAISPDGNHIAFLATHGGTRSIWIRHLDQDQPVAIDGTDGANEPFWSPDSQTVGFVVRGQLHAVPWKGGIARAIYQIQGSLFGGATWSPDGRTIVYSSSSPSVLHEVAASGGEAKVVASRGSLKLADTGNAAGMINLMEPHFLPLKGRRVLLFGYSAGWTAGHMGLIDLDSGRMEVLGEGLTPTYSPTGHLVYASATAHDLWARPFSLESLKPTGEAFPIAKSAAVPSVSADGTLIYADHFRQRLAWFHRNGTKISDVSQPLERYFYPAISPDGKRIAVEAGDGENLDIWVHDIARGARTRLTTDPATEVLPVWSPDGEEIAYSAWRSGSTDIFVRRADAGAPEKVLVSTPKHERVADWSRDGKYILFTIDEKERFRDLWYLSRNDAGGWEPHLLLGTTFSEDVAKFSPDGRFVAYISNATGRHELYVRPFPTGDRQWAVSHNGARQPRWSRNGKELFYEEAGRLMVVPVRTTPDFSAGAPVQLFENAGFGYWGDPNYDVSPDGERFLIPDSGGEASKGRTIHVVQNWFAEFRGRR